MNPFYTLGRITPLVNAPEKIGLQVKEADFSGHKIIEERAISKKGDGYVRNSDQRIYSKKRSKMHCFTPFTNSNRFKMQCYFLQAEIFRSLAHKIGFTEKIDAFGNYCFRKQNDRIVQFGIEII